MRPADFDDTCRFRVLAPAVTAFCSRRPLAHHEILAKFDDSKRMTLSGVVTLVDWRNPHVHVFMNVRDASNKSMNWAVELESPIDLQQSGWSRQSVKPGDAVRVEGMAARDGSRQVWGTSLVLTATGRQVLNVTPRAPARRCPVGRLRAGPMAGRASAPRRARRDTGAIQARPASSRTA